MSLTWFFSEMTLQNTVVMNTMHCVQHTVPDKGEALILDIKLCELEQGCACLEQGVFFLIHTTG